MGIKFYCPNGHKLNVKTFLAGKRGVCPHCDASVIIPLESQIPSGKRRARSPAQPTSEADSLAASGAPRVASGASLATSGAGNGASYAGPPFSAPTSDLGVSTVAGRNDSAVAYAPVPLALPVHARGPAMSAVQPPGSMSSSGNSPGIATAPMAHAAAIPTGTPVVGVARGGTWDPIAEAPEAVWFVRPPSGGQFGPARGEIMRKWIAEGRVTADSMVWREGWSDWRDAGPVFPELPAPPVLERGPHEPGLDFPGPATLTRSTASESASARVPLRSRRRKSPAMAIAMVTVLVLVSLGLLITLVYVLNNG